MSSGSNEKMFFGHKKFDKISTEAHIKMAVVQQLYFDCSHGVTPISKLKRVAPELIHPLKVHLNDLLPLIKHVPKAKQEYVYSWLGDFYRAFACVAKLLGNLEEAKMWFEKSLEFYNTAPKFVEVRPYKLDKSLEVLNILIDLKQKEESKKYIKICKELYDASRDCNVEGIFDFDDYYEKNKFLYEGILENPPKKSFMFTLHLALITAYKRYYEEIDKNIDKLTYYSILALKYQIVYDSCRSVSAWIWNCIEVTQNCRDLSADDQAHYLLLAARALLEKNAGKNIIGRSSLPFLDNEDFVKSLIDMDFVRHYVWVSIKYFDDEPIRHGKLVNENTLIEIEPLNIPKEAACLRLCCAFDEEKFDELKIKIDKILDDVEKRNLPKKMLTLLEYDELVEQYQSYNNARRGLKKFVKVTKRN